MPIEISGGCLCGAIRYEGTTEPAVQGHCQCRDCQRATGAGHATIMAVPESDIVVTGDLKFFAKHADSGNLVHRGFCPSCGSPVMSRNDGMAGLLFVMAGSLDDPTVLEPMFAVYASRGNDWDVLDPALMTFPEMPPTVPGQG